MFEGLIWYFVFYLIKKKKKKIRFVAPTLIVIINDISAFSFGKLFGKTPLLKLAPLKTLEGFLGSFIGTLILTHFVYYIHTNIY